MEDTVKQMPTPREMDDAVEALMRVSQALLVAAEQQSSSAIAQSLRDLEQATGDLDTLRAAARRAYEASR